ncbi:hypothetical protein BAUCODRAFT_36792 [Baudoinia panamericana UAMH 10762]|uniref:Symplekin/Pta1 N-terminal domain-containing protein n=1 Tax=Baudoinia panamericana (strain UAMH 10762) TaxID=717646 RepID=M2MNV5_BAUPA|nr:uncharacterized protein BAUCODRAFT_36792 [Baudoinia panamericana UAMH 10762]EMC93128.1 hypothetical protein BAUCODRAFT_36792 [Baudoinia panamericana UAMH 10762]
MTDTGPILKSLSDARSIVLGDPSQYSVVVQGVLPLIGANSPLELRRWGADFLAETFASPVVSAEEKQKLSLLILDTLRGYFNRKDDLGEEDDSAVIKSAVQCAASIYPLIFRHTISSPNDSPEVWRKMAGIKSAILRSMDTAAAGVRICCVKFVSRVVQVQTPGLIADPRRPEHNEISLALVPRDHPVLQPSQLEAEASGLLDRLLGVLQDDSVEALSVTATLNSLSILVQRRASIATKVLLTVLNYNPLRLAMAGVAAMSGKDRIALKSMTRTTISFLLNVLKRNPNHALAARLQQRVEQLRHSLVSVYADSGSHKRPAPDEPTDGLDNNKRIRVDSETTNGTTPMQQHPQPTVWPPPLPPGPLSIAQLFTLSADRASIGFHVEQIPQPIVQQLVPPLLRSIDQKKFNDAITAIQYRLLSLAQRPPVSALQAAQAVMGEDEDDDYDPEAGLGTGRDQVMNRLDQLPPENQVEEVALAPFELEASPPLNDYELEQYGKVAVLRVFGTLAELDGDMKMGRRVDEERSFNKLGLGGHGHEREGWITLLTRLATRSTFDLDERNSSIKQENDDRTVTAKNHSFSLADKIRASLLDYVMADFRHRIDVAIAWLNEEWYTDRLAYSYRHPESSAKPSMTEGNLPNYTTHCLRTLELLTTYLDVKDGRYLIRFLSEIPELDASVLERVKKLADDPERVQMATQALLYLIMLRPPVREVCIDAAEALWRSNEDAKGSAAKILAKWRPGLLGQDSVGGKKEDATGMKIEAGPSEISA